MILSQPEIVREPMEEVWVFQDNGSIGSSAAGETWDTTVDMRTGCDFDVSDRQPECGEYFPDGHLLSARLNPLTRAYTANLLVFETSEDVRKQSRGPDGIVIGKDDNVGGGIPNTVSHLESLVCERDGEDSDARGINRVCELLQGSDHTFFRDDDDLLGTAF